MYVFQYLLYEITIRQIYLMDCAAMFGYWMAKKIIVIVKFTNLKSDTNVTDK